MLRDGAERVARAVLVSCEAFDNLPARVTGRALALSGRLPPWAFGLFMQQMRLRAVRRLPIAFGWLTRGQLLSAPMVVLGIVFIVMAYRRREYAEPRAPEGVAEDGR